MRIFLRLSLLILSLVGLLVVNGCRQTVSMPPANAPAAQRERVVGRAGGTLSYRLAASPKTFNPLAAFDEPSLLVTYFLLNSRLVDFDHGAQKYVPALAESWQNEADGRTITVKLRDGLQFSDGHPLTADDVAFTLRAIYDERTKAPILRDSMLVENQPIAVKVQDARNLQLTFPRVVAAPENYLVNFPILPRHALEPLLQQGKLGAAWGLDADPNTIITAGPFTVATVTAGEQITLKRNPHYWKKDSAGASLPYLEQVVLPVIADANNAVARLGQGGLDIFDRIRTSDYATLRGATGAVAAYDLGPGLGIDHIFFNLTERKMQADPTKAAWFRDTRFRRAISFAIDRETLAKTTLQGLATPLYGFVSPLNREWAATDLPKTEYDLEQARNLLREAGFAVRGEPNTPELYDKQGQRVEFTLIVPAENEPRKLTAAIIQEDLARLGVKMQVAPIETQALNERWKDSFDYDAALFGLTVTDLEPSSYRNFLMSNADSHHWAPKQAKPATQWEAQLDKLFEEQDRTQDKTKRQALFHDIQRIMAEEMPILPVTARHTLTAAATRVGNYRPSPIVPYSLWNADEWFVQ